jgi:hypothetical protein
MATVSDTESPVKIYSTGTATEYTIPFDYISDSDITVTLVNISTGAETAQTLDVDYTIVDEAVTYSVAPGSAYKVVLQRVTPYTQEASFSAGEAPPLTTYESAFDKLTYLVQDLDERVGRSILLPSSSSVTDIEWPDLALNAGKLVRINTDGDGLESISTVAAGSALDVTAYCDAADLTELHAYQTTSGLTVSDTTFLHQIVTTSGVTNDDLESLHVIYTTCGLFQRAKFTYVDADTITIGPGVYQHAGTTGQIVYWKSTLTFDSTDSGSRWYYLYIDDSAVVSAGTNLLTAAEFTNSTTAPTWSDAKRGWYSGNDRCIFAYYVASGSIAGFYHDGGDYVSYASLAIDRAFADITKTETVGLTIPGFSTKAYVRFNVSLYAAYDFYCGPEAAGMVVVHSALATDSFMLMVMTSASQAISIGLSSYFNDNEVGVKTHGWFFPMGI